GIQNNDVITASYDSPAIPLSPVGSYPIVPTPVGAALANYSVTTNTGTLSILPAAVIVKADDTARSYGKTNVLNVSYSGFGQGQDTNILSGSPALNTIADTNSSIGTYPIEVSQGTLSVSDTNYSLVFSNGILTVTQAVLTVMADNQSRSYGDTNP